MTIHDHDVAAPCPTTCPLHDPNEVRCHCGCPILADTEDWPEPLCADHYFEKFPPGAN